MAIILPATYETKVEGDSGSIFISQWVKGETVTIYLTVQQFQEIWNYEKHLIDEAREEKDPK